MPTVDRRKFMQLAGGATALTMLPTCIARAAAIPAHRVSGSIEDVEHIVVLMQENRSFDHYFGTLRGVRGFGDPHPAVLPSGKSVWHQSDGTRDILPFRPHVDDLGLAFLQDLAHDWDSGHVAFNSGRYDQWIPAKTSTTMAHLSRPDMPFHFALADAFTVCDAYHCSLVGPTDPNRYYMWTGWTGNDGRGGGPVIANDELGYSWTTYPERLEAAGVSWKIYQDAGVGLDAAGFWGWTEDPYIGNYGDNSLLYFDQYRSAAPGTPLYDRARTGTNAAHGQSFFDVLSHDVKAGRLPQVSWVVAPEAFTEHPNWPANYGAWYVSKILDALTADPAVWARTALLVTYDENDGFFDHVVPPYPSSVALPGRSTVTRADEFYTGSAGTPGAYGLGQRVPMLVVSPWSSGGWVCSETFDHTSIIRFIEARHGVHEPNITPWRRTVCGDLTAAFDFSRAHQARPTLPSTAAFRPPDDQRHPDFVPVAPAPAELPRQERGTRPSRALGYRVDLHADVAADELRVTISNHGRLGAHVQARSRTLAGAPFSYTVSRGRSVMARWPVAADYDVSFHGPNGFFRRLAGDVRNPVAEVELKLHRHRGYVAVELSNPTSTGVDVVLRNAYAPGHSERVRVPAGATRAVEVDTRATGGWYDLSVTVAGHPGFARELAGRMETGRPSISDPQLGRH